MATIKVPVQLFNKMCKGVQCMNISEGFVNETFFYQNREVVITGTMSSGVAGYIQIWGHYVTDLESYKGDLIPLDRTEHWFAVCDGKRERGYRGQKTIFGKRTIVFIDEKITFLPKSVELQLELF